MGGRRAGNLGNLVGKGGAVTSAKGKLTRAVSSENPDAIAQASANLVASSDVGLQALRYGLKFAKYIEKNASKLNKLDSKERDEKVRRAWSAVKKREGIVTNREVDSVIINAANDALDRARGV